MSTFQPLSRRAACILWWDADVTVSTQWIKVKEMAQICQYTVEKCNRNGTDVTVHSGEKPKKFADVTVHRGEKPQEWWDADVTDAAAAGMQPQSEPR